MTKEQLRRDFIRYKRGAPYTIGDLQFLDQAYDRIREESLREALKLLETVEILPVEHQSWCDSIGSEIKCDCNESDVWWLQKEITESIAAIQSLITKK